MTPNKSKFSTVLRFGNARFPSGNMRAGIDVYNHHIRDTREVTLTRAPLALNLTLTPCATVLPSEEKVFEKEENVEWVGTPFRHKTTLVLQVHRSYS